MKILLFYILGLLGCDLCSAEGCKFPSSTNCSSPDLTWEIVCVSHKSNDGSYDHVLVLRGQAKTNLDSVEIHGFERSCEALWSKQGHYLALTDWLGSNVSEIMIMATTSPFKPRRLSEIVGDMADFLSKDEREGHIYFEAMEWLDEGKLRIRVFGHTDVAPFNEFEHQLICDVLKGRFAPAESMNKSATH